MENFTNYLKQARKDINHSLVVWTSLLTSEFSNKIKYMYAKGSAVKPWCTPLDYVPILSDLDIHIMLKDGNNIFYDEPDPVKKSLEISEKYEQTFTKEYSNALHLPRTQLVTINQLLTSTDYIPPRIKDVRIMYGEPCTPFFPEPHRIREIDYNHLIKIKRTVENIPMSLIDRSGLDYWTLIRKFNWQVSPTPVRLLTQVSDFVPEEIWSWNRTKITTEIENIGYKQIAAHYKQYYLSGWKAFFAENRDNHAFRQIIYHGYKVLYLSLQVLQEIK